jgi:hypothetical protein
MRACRIFATLLAGHRYRSLWPFNICIADVKAELAQFLACCIQWVIEEHSASSPGMGKGGSALPLPIVRFCTPTYDFLPSVVPLKCHRAPSLHYLTDALRAARRLHLCSGPARGHGPTRESSSAPDLKQIVRMPSGKRPKSR